MQSLCNEEVESEAERGMNPWTVRMVTSHRGIRHQSNGESGEDLIEQIDSMNG